MKYKTWLGLCLLLLLIALVSCSGGYDRRNDIRDGKIDAVLADLDVAQRLAESAADDTSLFWTAEWRGQWVGAWGNIAMNTTGKFHEVALVCVEGGQNLTQFIECASRMQDVFPD